ncbi:unnamed protein product [Brachionus calyciflorus]|uniref:Uncharacterized protein n=1 Tax=Brachionus calyciflorus TaxID=104777 RepID=A0A813NZA5_9BILA|nr:unnamed protein product [Brachionus calyciflorus]
MAEGILFYFFNLKGMDRIVRLYNPYVPSRPIAHLKSHTTPIFYIHLSNEDNRIFSISTDKCLNVWDLIDHSCLASIRPKSHKITGELQACCYNPKSKTILINSDKVSFLSLKLKANLHTEVILSHKEPVVCAMFNKQFKQLVSCSESGTIKLWDVESGRDLFEFSNAHGDQAITCMTFDDTGRRLITGGRDGQCKIWNFNNGHCLKILTKDNNLEISDVKYTKVYNNKFIINVGWDRCINIYDDDVNDVRLVLNPNPRWTDDIENGHREDILCLAKSDTNFLATSGYDGEIIVWNMVSGHVFTKLKSPKPIGYSDDNLDGDLNVNKMIFLNKERYNDKNATHLISSGPWGMIHFWTVFHGAAILARFQVSDKRGTNITRMIFDSKLCHLFAADNYGYIYHYNIDEYATYGPERHPPQLVRCWRAHTQNVTSLEYIETSKIVISTSSDCTIRVWKPDGRYIGTFGQDEVWNLYDEKTYKHPLVPYDVLVDEQSLPEHPVLSTRETFQEVLDSNRISEKIKKEQEKAAKIISNIKNYMIDDQTIMNQIKNMSVPNKVGKRLRHEITKPNVISMDKNSKNYYQMLKCYQYEPAPPHKEPPNSIKKSETKYYA